MREGADGARSFSDAQVFGGGAQSSQSAAGLFVPDGEFKTEGDGLGVDAVGAADLDGVLKFESAAF